MSSRPFYLASVLMVLALPAVSSCSAAHIKKDLTKRASFDLSCPADEMTTTILSEKPGCGGGDPYHCALSVGVTGCGKKTVFVRNESGNGPMWIRNAEVEETAQ